MRGIEIQTKVTLVTETCIDCGMIFALAEDVQRHYKDTHATFYCPAGHAQCYAGKTDAEQLREELDRARRLLSTAKADYDYEYKARLAAERSLKAAKADHARTKKRVAHGVCPCCNRSFVNLQRHMEGQHPGFESTS